MRGYIFIILSLILTAGCKTVRSVFEKKSPYEQYLESLEKAELGDKPMVAAWITAGKRVFEDSIQVSLPFSESGFFDAGEPEARSYRFDVRAGQVLMARGVTQASFGGDLFIDLFTWSDNRWDRTSFSDSTVILTHEFDRNEQCLLRLQPELMVDMYYALTISLTPALVNPVSEATRKSIGSFYGDPRNGGMRSHEGVDIFASRGTPVIAPTGGYITQVGRNNLGGKVIWMRDLQRGHNYYFAHLDSQLVATGDRVSRGDTLGTVGNTGNARSTPPHLHFGIYQHGSRDPLYYIHEMEALTEESKIDTSMTRQAHKVLPMLANLRSDVSTSGEILDQLRQGTYVKVIGQSLNWYRVLLPDHRQGFLHQNLAVPLESGGVTKLSRAAMLHTSPGQGAIPIRQLRDSIEVEILAQFRNYHFVKTADGITGWIRESME